MSDHDAGTSRRRVIKGAVWTAPAIVIATAAPAFAASGPAAVTTTVRPATHSDTKLPITIDFLNRNTGATGLTNVFVKFTPTAGTVTKSSVADVAPGWTFNGSSNDAAAPTLAFSHATGIAGAPTASGTATTTLSFTATVVPVAGQSAGTIAVSVSPSTGSITGGNGGWA